MVKKLLILRKYAVKYLSVLFMLLIFQNISFADEFKNSKEYDVIWKNTYTSLYTLTNVLNNPNAESIGKLNKIIVSDSVSLTDFNTNTLTDNPLIKQSEIQLDILNINKLSAGYTVRVRCLLHVRKYQFSKELSIKLSFIENSVKIYNIQKILFEIQNFKDDKFKELNKLPQNKTTTSIQKSLSITNYQSDNLIHRQVFYSSSSTGDLNVFDKNTSMILSNNIIFSRPYGVLSYRYVDADYFNMGHNILLVTDANWNRLIVSDSNNFDDYPWIKSIGRYGAGNFEYRTPQGIDNLGMNKVFIADGYNNRVQAYEFNFDGTTTPGLLYDFTISDNFDFVSDVAVGYIPNDNSLYDSVIVAVLDNGNCKVNFYDENGSFKSSLFSSGTGVDQLNNPTSICFARDINTNYQTDYIYITDAGNNRVVVRRTSGISNTFRSTESTLLDDGSFFQFPTNAYLTSVTVDEYGYVYIVDQSNSKIYKFSRHLGKLIAIFGSEGVGDNQLFYPNKFNIVKGEVISDSFERFVPIIGLGEAIVTECFGEQSGIRKYKLGNDILSYQSSYLPKLINYGLDWLKLEWYQTGITKRWIKIYYNGILIDSSYHPLELPLTRSYSYNLADSAQDGYYRYEITSQSIYSGVASNTIIDSIYIARYIDPGPQFVIDSVRIHDPTGEMLPFCLYDDPDKWWVANIYARDAYNNAPLTYMLDYYSSGGKAKVYIDTTSAQPLTAAFYTITDHDSVYFKIPRYPLGCGSSLKCDYILFEISVTDEPYDTNKIFCTEYTWDTISPFTYTHHIYSALCKTPCTPDCPPPPACPKLYSWNGNEYLLENNILPQSEYYNPKLEDKFDYYPLFNSTLTSSNEYKFIINETENEITFFDQIELYSVDIPITDEAIIFDSKQKFGVLRPNIIAPISAITNDSIDILADIEKEDDLSFNSTKPGYMIVEYLLGDPKYSAIKSTNVAPGGGLLLSSPNKNLLKLVVDSNTFIPNIYNIYIENNVGDFILIDTIPPRGNNVNNIVNLSDYTNDKGILKIKLEWTTKVDFNSLPYYEYEYFDTTTQKLNLSSAVHSDQGEVNNILDKSTSERITLEPNQEIEFTFSADTIATGYRRLLYLKFKGRYKSLRSNSEDQNTMIPDQFSLSQNYPNPFNPSTVFEFDLPKTTDVKFEIFNVLGQKVKTLINSKMEAGSHSVEWNSWDDAGSRVASGIYFAKFSAGEYKTTKKMVVLK